MSLSELTIFVGSPDTFAPRAAWVLQTVMAPLGRRVAITRDPAAAAALVRGVAGRRRAGDPCSAAAIHVCRRATLPAGSFAAVRPRRASLRCRLAGGASRHRCKDEDDQSGGDPSRRR